MDQEAVVQNLEDAGCSAEFIQRYLETAQAESGTADRLRLLERQRRELLDRLHDGQRMLDCLDHLRYQLQKRQKQENAKRG